jgi:hypothetical protein
MKKLIFIVLFAISIFAIVDAISVIDFPTTAKQSCGKEFSVFSTGDEFYSRMHDYKNFIVTID